MPNLPHNSLEPQRRRDRGGSAEELNRLSEAILGSAISVHRKLGPGLLESVYEDCLAHELTKLRIPFRRQIPMPIIYDGVRMESAFRIDLLVANRVVVEIKAVNNLLQIHQAQLLTYLRLSERPLGLLLNFNASILKEGIIRLVNRFPDPCQR